MLSVDLAGSKKTRLLKHGSAGKLVEYVELSWVAKPWGRSARSVTFRMPPALGVWAGASPGAAAIAVAASAAPSARRAKRMCVIAYPLLCVCAGPPEADRDRVDCGGKISEG